MQRPIVRRVALGGVVVDGPAQRPVADALVTVADEDGIVLAETRTDSRGLFYFMRSPGVRCILVTNIPERGRRYGHRLTEVPSDPHPKGQPFRLLQIPLLTTDITGTVTREKNGSPIVMAEVRLRATNELAQTDPDGNYTLRAVQPGQRTLLVEALGFHTRAIELMVEAGGTRTCNINLREAGVSTSTRQI